MPMQQAIALLPSSGRISSRTWPPCAKRMNLDTSASSELMPWPVGEATHMQPAASMQHPSGLTPGSEAHTRWSLSRPVLTSMSNAVNWLLEVSPTISVWPSGVITKPFGEPLTAAGDVRQHDTTRIAIKVKIRVTTTERKRGAQLGRGLDALPRRAAGFSGWPHHDDLAQPSARI